MKPLDGAPARGAFATAFAILVASCHGDSRLDGPTSKSPSSQPDDVASRIIAVPNGTFEQAEELRPDMPWAWRRGSWGLNEPVFTYPVSGRDASSAAGLMVARYTSGDAKWYFEPVPVTPGTRYLFSDTYQADVESIVVVRFTLTDGTFQNLTLAPAPPAAEFMSLQRAFVAPPGAARATVFHGLAAVGSLRIDDVTLALAGPVRMVRGVANGDLEQQEHPDANAPAAFHPNRWGQHDARFSYPTEGHSGRRSVRIDMTSHIDGTAAWYFDEQPVGNERAFWFETSYRANVDIIPQARARLRSGTTVNVALPRLLRAGVWTRYATPLWLPDDTEYLTVLHVLPQPGFVQTDDYALRPYEAQPFRRGIVSLTFDDGWRSDYDTTMPILERHGARGTFYVLTDRMGEPARVSLAMLADMQRRGHEIGAHTVRHASLPPLPDAELEHELGAPKSLLEGAGLRAVISFASPYGAYDARTLARIPSYYRSHRTTEAGFNTKDAFDPLRLRVQSMRSTTSVPELASWAARAAADRCWLILVYHEVADPTSGAYAVTPATLDAQMSALSTSGLPFLTVSQALDELTPQL